MGDCRFLIVSVCTFNFAQLNQDRRERLRKLALETVDLNKDPYFMRNHLGELLCTVCLLRAIGMRMTALTGSDGLPRSAGSYECKLCLTIHTNEGNYLAHTQVPTTYIRAL